MISRPQVMAMCGIVILTVLLNLLFAGQEVTTPLVVTILLSIGVATGVMMLLLPLFDHFLWRWGRLQGWFLNRPHLYGEWEATISSRWVDPETNKRPNPIKAKLIIKETYSRVHVRLETDEFKGDLLTSSIERAFDGTYRLYGTYRNEPSIEVRDRSQAHTGAFELEIRGDPNNPTELVGEYWTARGNEGGTQGSIVAVRSN